MIRRSNTVRRNRSSYPLVNPLCATLGKPCTDFRRGDLLEVIEVRGIERITFHHTGLDGRLKELVIPVADRRTADRVLADGERVDGSSLFRGVVETGRSDLYVVPVYRSAFLNPFDERSLDLICRFLTREGEIAPFTPDAILGRASRLFESRTGLALAALGELEFFLLSDRGRGSWPAESEQGYHNSSPFSRSGPILNEMVRALMQVTGAVKYAHSEVGSIESVESDREELQGARAEQLEIEFLPRPVEEMADDLAIGRWLIRTIASRHGCLATFTPKIDEGVAGNGLHIHMELLKAGRNIMRGPGARLTRSALGLVGGLCEYADSLTAFGNTVPSSYLRLTPDHEAPTRICWSDQNRSAMIRVPLAWSGVGSLAAKVNSREQADRGETCSRQTVELRSPDGSANIHLLLAGITMAAEWGLAENPSSFSGATSLQLAERLFVNGDIQADPRTLSQLPRLPASCADSGRILRSKRGHYERDGVFPPSVVDWAARQLCAEGDEEMAERLAGLPADDRLRETRRVMHGNIHRN
jgi:glutamine synthetase